MAPHSSTLAWKLPWTEEPGRLQSMGSLRVGHGTRLSDFTLTFHFHALEKEMTTHSSVLAWRIPEMGERGGLPSMGLHRIRHNWSDLAAAATICSYKITFHLLFWTAICLLTEKYTMSLFLLMELYKKIIFEMTQYSVVNYHCQLQGFLI